MGWPKTYHEMTCLIFQPEGCCTCGFNTPANAIREQPLSIGELQIKEASLINELRLVQFEIKRQRAL